MKKSFKAWLVTALLVLFVAAPALADTVRIGLMCPLTGKWASEGQGMRDIVTMMMEDVNKAGGVNGNTLELVVEDDAGDPRTASLAAQKLVSAGVVAVIGTYGSAVTEASQNIIDEAEVVQIATGSTSIRLSEKGMKYFFRTNPRDDEQGRCASEALASMGYKAVAVLHDNSSYAKGLAEEIVAGLKKLNTPVVFYDALTPGERDYTAILTKLKSANPDVIFFTGYYPEAGMMLRQRDEMNWKVDMMGGDATNNTDIVVLAGKSAEGFYFVSPPSAGDFDNPLAKEFMARYQAKYGSMPASVYTVLTGDAFRVIVAALEAGVKPESKAIAEYLHNGLKDYPGLSGSLGFNEKGDRVGDLYRVYVIRNGEFVLYK